VWADRIRRKFVMIGADVFRGGLAAILVFATTSQCAALDYGVDCFSYGASVMSVLARLLRVRSCPVFCRRKN
jgi:uncharacterized protein with PIN domain